MKLPMRAPTLLAAATFALTLFLRDGRAAVPSPPPTLEDPVKAAYLYQFARFVEWPAASPLSEGPLRICVLGSDTFVRALQLATQDKRAAARLIEVEPVARVQDVRPCPIVFVDSSVNGATAEILRRLTGSHALVVGDAPGFAHRGGIIGFFVEENRVRFEINVAAARAAGLHVSARLLDVARLVEPDATSVEAR